MNNTPFATGNESGSAPKPRLLFFQYKYDERLPSFLLMHKREHAQCLQQFFDVTVISENCDYGRACDTHQPDLVLFESGVPNPACRRLEITNTDAHGNVPKLGFLHADGFCCARAGFLSDMDQWGIDTFFAIATTAGEHIPAIADNLFIWPNFADPEIYRDYGQVKSIPVLFTGNSNSVYPWRQEIMKLVSGRYPSLMCPHPGYAAASSAGAQFTIGEPYARMINASWCVPACGAVARELVRKHLEVPASRACLITEKSAALEAAGFMDMTNCVFAGGDNILEKLEFLFSDLDRFSAIIDAGHNLVHSRHTIRHRDQIFQWFTLHRQLKPGEKIVQDGPFEALRVAKDSPRTRNAHIRCDGVHLTALAEGDQKLLSGQYKEAEKLYRKCASYISYMPEPKLRLALCSLYLGNAKKALSYVRQPLQFTLAEYRAADPDPVEWAYLIVSLLCMGDLNAATQRASEFSWLQHCELNRVRWAIQFLANDGGKPSTLNEAAAHSRADIHHLPVRTFTDWIEQLRIMLAACGQQELAARFAEASSQVVVAKEVGHASSTPNRGTQGRSWLSVARRDAHGSFSRALLSSKVRSNSRRVIAKILRWMEGKYGYFLPYRLSTAKRDEFYSAIEDLAREAEIRTGLVIGATPGKHNTEAVLTGILDNENSPAVFCVSIRKRSFPAVQEGSRNPRSTWYQVPDVSREQLLADIHERITEIKRDHRVASFDLVLINGLAFQHVAGSEFIKNELRAAKAILLDDLSGPFNFENYDELTKDSSLVMTAHNPDLRNGYSIFRRKSPSSAEFEALCTAPWAAE